MPPRTRRAATPVDTAATPESPLSSVASSEAPSSPRSPTPPPRAPQTLRPGLQFSQPLSWRAGRPISVADLLKRLQALAAEMHEMDQDEDEAFRSSFTKSSKELADPQLLDHKDKGVRAWVACCAVDVLRLCAPDAPFTERQLRVSYTLLD